MIKLGTRYTWTQRLNYTFTLNIHAITVAGIHLPLVHYATFVQMTRWDQCLLRLSRPFVLSS